MQKRNECSRTMSIQKKFSSGVAWMSAGSWIEQAVNFAIFALLARLLGVEAFGFLAMAAAFVLIPEFLVRESVSEILLTRDALSPGRLNSVFWLLTMFGTALSAILLAASGPIARFYGAPEVGPLIVALSPTVSMIALTAVPVALLRRNMQFRVLALRAVAGVVAGGVVGVGMALAGYGVWSLAGQRVTQVGVNVIMAWAAVSWRPGIDISLHHIRDVFHFGHRMVGLRAAELTAVQMPSIIVGVMLGPTQAGLFSIAWRVVEIASFLVITPLRMVAQPAFSSVARSGGHAANLLVDIMRMAGLVVFPAFAGLAVLAEPALIVLFGQKWAPAAPVLSVMSIFGMYLCIEKVQQTYCLAVGKVGVLALLAWCEVGLAATLIYLAVSLDLTAVAAAFVAGFLIVWPLRFRNLAAIADIGPGQLARVHILPMTITVVMTVSVWLLANWLEGSSNAVILGLGTLTGILIFTVLTLLLLRNRLHLLRSFLRPAPVAASAAADPRSPS